MTVELALMKGIQGLEVQRTTKYTDYKFDEIEPRLFRLKGSVIKEANMLSKSDEYWAQVRQVPLTKKESNMDIFMNRIEQIPGFKYVIFGAKALIENFVETGSKKHPSKFDFGPINTMITSNYVNGTRFRVSGMTTGNLDPHWSFSGYGAYGTRDKNGSIPDKPLIHSISANTYYGNSPNTTSVSSTHTTSCRLWTSIWKPIKIICLSAGSGRKWTKCLICVTLL